jgi:transketolase
MNAALSNRSTRSTHDPKLLAKLAVAAHAIRTVSIAAIYHAGSGHPGGALSAADLLAVLYGAEMNVWPERLSDPNRDRFVLSKGHAAPALYAAGAHFGFCSADEALSLRKLGSPFQGHPHVCDLSWVETSTGSLGQGFSVALEMAMGLKLKKSPARVYAMLGDGELQDCKVGEAAMRAAQHKIDNLVTIVDYNKLQSDDSNANIMGPEPLAQKVRAFGWHLIEIDGHDLDAILSALEEAYEAAGKPSLILAHTVRGNGVSTMENISHRHGSVKLTRRQAEDALAQLGVEAAEFGRLLDVRH